MVTAPPGSTRAALPAAVNRALAATGIAAAVLCAALIGSLHVLPPSAQLDPVRRTISHYALLENGWLFDLAVLALAAGALAVLAALLGARVVERASGGAAALLTFAVALVAVVVFEKHNWAVGPSVSGDIHRLAGLVAFVSLPVAALLVARPWLDAGRWSAPARCAVAAAGLSLVWLAPVVAAVLTEPWTGVRWWRAVPLGSLERLLGASELIGVVVLGWWAARAARGGAPAQRAATRGTGGRQSA